MLNVHKFSIFYVIRKVFILPYIARTSYTQDVRLLTSKTYTYVVKLNIEREYIINKIKIGGLVCLLIHINVSF